ncbi:MAG: hypothetical protein ACKO2L_13810, partial [Planctomycetaceae bacterium]
PSSQERRGWGMNTCQYCRTELDESEIRVCSSCDAHEFDLAKEFVDCWEKLLSKHPAAANYFGRCRTTREKVERFLSDFVELREVMSDYVCCGGSQT